MIKKIDWFTLVIGLFTIAIPIPVIALTSKSNLAQTQSVSAKADRLFEQAAQFYQANQLAKALELWELALQEYMQIQDNQAVATTLKNLATANITLQNDSKAISYLEKYLTLMQKMGDKSGETFALTRLADTYSQQSNYKKAIEYYLQSSKLATQQEQGIILGNLAIAYKTQGNYIKAIETNQQALKVLQSVKNQSGEGQVLSNLGNIYEALGDYDNAIISYEQSLAIAQKIQNPVGEAVALNNLGGIYANLGQYEEALAKFQNSLDITKKIGDRVREASVLINIGSAYHAMGKRDAAIQNYQQSLQIAQSVGDKQRTMEALGNLGVAREDLQQYPQAIDSFQKSLEIARLFNNPEAQGMALNNLGHALFRAGQLDKAETTLREAIQLLDKLRPGLSDSYKVSIFDTQVHTYNLLQQILIAANKPDLALEAAEQGRARAFVELLANRFAGTQNKQNNQENTPISLAKIQEIARQQNATLVEYAIIPDDDFKFRGKQRARESELLIWVVQPTGKVTLRRSNLKFLWQHDWTLTKLVNTSRCLSGSPSCKRMNKALSQLKLDSKLNSKSEYLGLAKLHEILIAPIADLLPKDPNSRVVFIPQESLFLVPFPALINAEGKYLIEQHTITTVPAIEVLALTHQQRNIINTHKSASLQTLIVGNPTMPKISNSPNETPQQLAPLPGSELEAIEVGKLFNQSPLIGSQASKATVKQKLSQARIIHLATHGLLEYQSQTSSSSLNGLGIPGAIALAPSGRDDGILTASEIFDMRLIAELVVLSACDTGRGRITGDGVIGLSRAFISAGVPSVLVSLWSVPDAPTSQLMINFYQRFRQNPDKAQALRQAMLAVMKTNPKPFDWAAFTLIGEAD